jgi:glutamine amidotransferase
MKIGIINYGMGNLASVLNAMNHLSVHAEIFADPAHINKYDKLILPGVGAFGQAMKNLKELGFEEKIKEAVLVKHKPILGICLGMQLLLSQSTEHGIHNGLDLVPGKVDDFAGMITGLPVPHVGWNDVKINNSRLFPDNSPQTPDFYFVHSFYCRLQEEQYVTGFTEYGITFHSMFEKENIAGCQFHPEKSQRHGLEIFKRFGSN